MKVDPIRIVLSISIWFLLMVAASAYYLFQWLNIPHTVQPEFRNYEIKTGASLYSVAYELNEMNIVRWPKAWVLYARFRNMASIKAGEYRLSERESPLSLLTRFQQGDVVQYQITLVEGLTFRQMLQNLHDHERIKETLVNKTEQEIIEALNIGVEHLEGWFYPDTYNFSSGDTDADLLRRAFMEMQTILDSEWEKRSENLPYKTPYDALIMASIVEKETGVAFERREIAGVFVRRLQKNMRLQTDPTVIYGMGEDYNGNLRKADLTRRTPYNTYVIKGLPPTPIAMPGKHAIHAALNPAAGSSLYFVAKGDGTHQFSDTLEEHTQAVARYQKKRRPDYRSSPEASE